MSKPRTFMTPISSTRTCENKTRDRLFELGEAFTMDSLTIHLALKFFEIILHYVNFYQRNNRTQKLPSDPKPVKEVVTKSSVFFGKDQSQRVKNLASYKKELLMVCSLLIAAKFNERDDQPIQISELQKLLKHNFTWKIIVACEAKILQELNWNITMQTPLHFVKLFSSAGLLFSDDIVTRDDQNDKIQLFSLQNGDSTEAVRTLFKNVHNYLEYIADFSTNDYFMLKFSNEVVALS